MKNTDNNFANVMAKTMKKSILIIGALAFLAFSAEAEAARVKGYVKPSSGKYVQPHFRTNKNKTKIDNYSSKPNNNPFTGKKGSVEPFKR